MINGSIWLIRLFPTLSKNGLDKVKWKWSSNGIFSTKSVYDRISTSSCESRRNFKHIWKSKLPYKIKIFTWLLENNVILTKDNLVKKRWPGNPTCAFCSHLETADYLFFQCSVSRVTWGFVAACLGTREIPNGIPAYSGWIQIHLPGGTNIYTSSLPPFVGRSGSAETKHVLIQSL